MSDSVTVPRQFLIDHLRVLNRIPCQFWACTGPELPPVDMVTCSLCVAIAELRQVLGLPVRVD